MIDAEFKETIDACDEIFLYLTINSLGGGLFYIRHDLADGRIESTPEIEEWLTEAQAQIEYAVDQTVRFGVEAPRGENRVATAEYWEWFRKHDSWWKSLDESEQKTFLSQYEEKAE